MPLPMVLATAVPRNHAAMKLQNAASSTAFRGVRTRVETTVAMLLAASRKPFRKSKTRAVVMVMMRSSSPGFTGAGTSRAVGGRNRRSSVALQRDCLQYVGRVLCFVGRGLKHFVQFLDLDELNGIFFIIEKIRNGFAAQAIGLVFQAMDLYTMLQHQLILFQQRDSLG